MSVQISTEKKLLTRLASVIFLLYFLFSVDRGNVGFAGLQMTRALGLSAETFGLGSGLFTVGYLLFQVPNAVWLRRLGGGRAFATIACAWGVVSTATAFVPDQTWFLVNRFLLGVAEAGFNAFVIYYINMLFPRRLRGFAVGLTLLAVPVSLIVASPISGLLLNQKLAGLQGWQVLFLAEGLPTLLLAMLAPRLLPTSSRDMKFLSVEQRAWLDAELGQERYGKPGSSARALKDACGNPLVWALGYILFTTVFLVNVMLIWMPQIIKQMSHEGNLGVGFLNSVPWMALGVGIVLVSRVSDKVPNRITVLWPSLGIAAVGFMLSAGVQGSHAGLAFAGLLLGSFGGGAAQGVFWAVAMDRLRGPSAATAYAVITVLGNGSGVFAHPLIGKLHDATGSFAGVAWALAGFNLVAIAVAHWIGRHATPSQAKEGSVFRTTS
jgi:ACS family tartrate transporter-like MFS transporter